MTGQEKRHTKADGTGTMTEFIHAMEAMKAAGGRISYFVCDHGSFSPGWDKVLFTFAQRFTGSELLIIEIPKEISKYPGYDAISAIIDRFCSECAGIIRVDSEDGTIPETFYHSQELIVKAPASCTIHCDLAQQNGISIADADEYTADCLKLPFLTEDGRPKPLVSICIPTKNRADCLESTLDSIISQPEFQEGKVEVVISDNCSTDATESLGRRYAAMHGMVRYFRNEEDIVGANFNLALVRGSGLLRKLNNDTCMLLPGGLDYLCSMAIKYAYAKPAMYFGNAPESAGDGDYLLLEKLFLLKESFRITWIASFAIWDCDCPGIEREYIDGEPFWQVRKILELIEKRRAVAACDRNIMVAVAKDKSYTGRVVFETFFDAFFKIVRGLLSESERDYIEKDLLYHQFATLRFFSIMYPEAVILGDDYDEVMQEYYGDKPYWDEFLAYYKMAIQKLSEGKVFYANNQAD